MRKPRKQMLISLLVLCASIGANAATCADLFRTRESEATSPTFAQFFYHNIIAADPREDLDFTWNIPYPNSGDRWGGKLNRDYVSRPMDPKAPLVGIARLFGDSGISTKSFYAEAYAHYEGRFRDELIQNLKSIDSQLDRDRTSLGVIREAPLEHGQQGTVVGTFRAYDGSSKPWGLYYESDLPWAPKLGSLLPFQRINRARGVSRLKIEDSLALKITNGRKVIELGKFSIETVPAKRDRVRNLIESFWLEHIVKRFPDDTTFVAHVAGKVHARLYERRYGFKVVETFDVPGSKEPEMIMTGDGATLKRTLKAAIEIAQQAQQAPAAH